MKRRQNPLLISISGTSDASNVTEEDLVCRSVNSFIRQVVSWWEREMNNSYDTLLHILIANGRMFIE